MKHFYFFFLLALFPSMVFAHAFPISYAPDGFSSQLLMPSEVVISFTQEIAPISNGIEVFGPDGSKLPDLPAVVNKDSLRTLSRALATKGDGVYVVSWHGVSSEDGHFTKGAFSFFVGPTSTSPELYGGVPEGGSKGQDGWYKKMRTNFLSFSQKKLWSVTKVDAGRIITLRDSGTDVLRLSARNARGLLLVGTPPTVLLDNAREGIGPLAVPVKDQGGGVYDIPWVLFTPTGEWRVALTFTESDAYDINATIAINYPDDIAPARIHAEHIARTLQVLPAEVTLVILIFFLALHFRKEKKL